jgi:hypothetical protein
VIVIANSRSVLDMDAEEYHAHPAVGSSMLETLRDSRREYQYRYIVPPNERLPKREPTLAMNLGTLIHYRTLQPELFADKVADPYPEEAPDGKKWLRHKGSDHERWWAEEVAARAGKVPCDKAMLETVDAVSKSIRKHPHFAALLGDGGTAEHSLFWIDSETGIECKCRLDWLGQFALDLKTTARVTPAGYARQLVSMGYHRKLAHYTEGIRATLGEPIPFVHVAAETEWPYRVAIYEIDDRDRDGIRLGVAQRRETLRTLADCLAKDDWREPWETQVTALRLPGWAFTENDYQMGVTDGDS